MSETPQWFGKNLRGEMKVAVNTLFLIPGEVGGSETYLRETLLAVACHHPDIQLALVTNEENDEQLRQAFSHFSQCSFHQLPVRATNRYARIIAEQTRLPGLLRRIQPDLLWSPGYTTPLLYGGKQVVTIHDMQYRSHPDDLGLLARLVTHLLVCGAARRCDGIIAISEFTKQEILNHTAARASTIHVTLEGVDPSFAERQAGSETKGQQGVRVDPPYILSVANSYPHKNLHRLVDAFASIMDQIPHQLVLVGRPRLGEPLLQRSLARVPPERVHRLSGLSRGDLIGLYQHADLFVFPSLYEGFGLPVLEAMMAGVPVVTTREGSIPEVGGDEVIYADGRDPADLAANMLETLQSAPEALEIQSQCARARAASFTWSAAAGKTVTAWRDISPPVS
jgi:glycosyltransferase involved in cell wall biosynthesis